MLIKIGIENFKAFGKYTEFKLGELTVYAGLNSSGKSSIYQALFLLIQSYGKYYDDVYGNRLPYLDLNGKFAKLGKNHEILHNSDINYLKLILYWDNGLQASYKYQLNDSENEIGSSSDKNHVFFLSETIFKKNNEVQLRATSKQNEWEVEAYQSLRFVEFDIQKILYENIVEESSNEIETDQEIVSEEAIRTDDIFLERVIFKNVSSIDLNYGWVNGFQIQFKAIDQSINPMFRGKIDWPSVEKDFIENDIAVDSVMLVNAAISRYMKYELLPECLIAIPPFRGYPQRLYTDSTDPNPLSLYINKAKSRVNYYYDFEKDVPVEGSLEEAFNFWIVDHFKLADQVCVEEPIPGLATEIYIKKNGQKIPIINVGFGTSQILPVIFLLLVQGSPEKIIIVDEPEIHLHPSLQSKLADFFFSMSLTGRNIFIETHSEYLIDKLIYLSLIHEEKKDVIKLNWVKSNNGESLTEPISYDGLGYLIDPPDGFLNEKKRLVEKLNKIRLEKMNSK